MTLATPYFQEEARQPFAAAAGLKGFHELHIYHSDLVE
jgi:hypothetical protein